jgi:hypothetical protein
MNENVEQGRIPKNSLPFGFRGLPAIKTTNTLTDSHTTVLVDVLGKDLGELTVEQRLSKSNYSPILPPIPYRFKVTRGKLNNGTLGFVGEPGQLERVDARQYWGVMTKRLPSKSEAIRSPNEGTIDNPLVKNYTKFLGIQKLDCLVTGSGADEFNSNKFTLSRVALPNAYDSTKSTLKESVNSVITGSVSDHMIGTAYVRNAVPEEFSYCIDDRTTGLTNRRFSFASLIHGDPIVFNRFTPFAKFTNVFYGGFDGVNILDRNIHYFKDKSLSTDTDDLAGKNQPSNGLPAVDNENQAGYAKENNSIYSINSAIDILTDTMSSNINILTTPGIRNEYVTNHAMQRVRDYSLAMYILDPIKYDENAQVIFDDTKAKPDVRHTSELFVSRAIDNNYAAAYFPDVLITDPSTGRNVKVPASVAALGVLAFNDRDKAPWYAPAGFTQSQIRHQPR